MYRILLVDDDPTVHASVAAVLRDLCLTDCALEARAALGLAGKHSYDLIILDVGLPETDGFQLFSQIRRTELHQDTPIVFLSSSADPDDKVTGLHLGADDYIVKGCHPKELVARVESKISGRRKIPGKNLLIGRNMKLDLETQEISFRGPGGNQQVQLTPTEFRLFCVLAKNSGVPFTRKHLIAEVWGGRVHVIERSIDRHICAIRKKIGGSGVTILTVELGYRLHVSSALHSKAA